MHPFSSSHSPSNFGVFFCCLFHCPLQLCPLLGMVSVFIWSFSTIIGLCQILVCIVQWHSWGFAGHLLSYLCLWSSSSSMTFLANQFGCIQVFLLLVLFLLYTFSGFVLKNVLQTGAITSLSLYLAKVSLQSWWSVLECHQLPPPLLLLVHHWSWWRSCVPLWWGLCTCQSSSSFTSCNTFSVFLTTCFIFAIAYSLLFISFLFWQHWNDYCTWRIARPPVSPVRYDNQPKDQCMMIAWYNHEQYQIV